MRTGWIDTDDFSQNETASFDCVVYAVLHACEPAQGRQQHLD
jgi:hypothetical protein